MGPLCVLIIRIVHAILLYIMIALSHFPYPVLTFRVDLPYFKLGILCFRIVLPNRRLCIGIVT